MSQALNSTAFDIRRQIVDRTYPQSFNVKNKRFANAMFRVEKASKRKLSLLCSTGLAKTIWLCKQKAGQSCRVVATLLYPAGLTNAQQQARYRAHGNRDRLLQVAKPTYTTLRGGQQAIVQPQGRGKVKRLKVMYVLEQTARIPKRFDFYEDANTVSRRKFDKNFSKAFARAKATARRR